MRRECTTDRDETVNLTAVVLDDAALERQMWLLHQVMDEDREILEALAKV